MVKWATNKQDQWKAWRHTKNSSQANDIILPQQSPASSPALGPSTDNSVPDWRRKYQLAAEKKKELAAQKMKNGSSNEAEEQDRIVPSQAPADILSSLLSAQSATADLRKGRRPAAPEENKPETRAVPKLIAAPKESTTSGEEAAKYNSMLV